MADIFSAAKRSEIMSSVKGRGNLATELRIIALFRKNAVTGWRRRIPLFGNPDFVFPKVRLTVFVDGCFWHGCPNHGTIPDSNGDFWRAKLKRNKLRDRLVNQTLKRLGWQVLRVWQHELTAKNEKQLMLRLKASLGVRRDTARGRSESKCII